MKNIKTKKIFYKSITSYLLTFLVFILLHSVLPIETPFIITGYPSMAIYGLNPFILTAEVVIILLIFKSYDLILPTVISLTILSIIFTIYKMRKSKPGYEIILFILLSLTYYFVTEGNFYYALIISVGITVTSLLLIGTINYLTVKGTKFYPTPQELIILSITIIIINIGIINTISIKYAKLITILLILILSKTTVDGIAVYASVIISIPYLIVLKNPYLSLFFIYATFLTTILNNVSKYLSGISVLLIDYAFFGVLKLYQSYSVYDFCLLTLTILFYFLLPKKFIILLKNHLTGYKNKYLTKQTINRNRTILSDKLYDLSYVFKEISNSFEEFKKVELSETAVINTIIDDVYLNVCKKCDKNKICPLYNAKNDCNIKSYLEKLISIGLAKGKVTFMDAPEDLTKSCLELNPIMYSINKQITDYKTMLGERELMVESKDLIARQADGVAQMLKNLALSTSTTLKYNSNLDEMLTLALLKRGINPLEVLIYGEDSNLSVSIMLSKCDFNFTALEKTVSDVLKTPLKILTTNKLNNNFYVFLSKPAKFQAVYGVSTATKTLSETSGDTHTEEIIPNNKFLCAISDGMGSGFNANKISSITLSLIESFYKAGLSSDTVLPLVNKILSINTNDNFSALDIAIIDLNNLSADFIKFGAPRGYVISESGIKIVEGNTLPIGILKELQPAVARTTLNKNDVLVMISDGVQDAFKSSSEIIDFLKTLTAKNPKSVSNAILDKAKSLNDNVNLDDMTVLCVRIYEKIYEV